MRTVEMLAVYLALLVLPTVAWRWRCQAELWIVVLPCLAILTLYSLAVPSLGALHRFRYGFRASPGCGAAPSRACGFAISIPSGVSARFA